MSEICENLRLIANKLRSAKNYFIQTIKQLAGTLETRESRLPGIQRAEESLFFYLDLDIGQPWVNFKAINFKLLQIVGHIVF